MKNTYDGFEDWNDLQKEYETTDPQPEEVYLAVYDGGGYDGHSFVAFRNGDDYFLNESSHCSCYGLEGSWRPEKYNKQTFLETLKIREPGYYVSSEMINQVLEKLTNKGDKNV